MLLVAAPAAAQTAIPRIEFDEAVRRAVEKNPTVAEAATQIARAQALIDQARALTLPNISGLITNTTIDHAVSFSGGVTQPQNQTAFGLSASIGVFTPARWAAVAQARDSLEVAKITDAEARRQMAIAAAQAYLTIIGARRQVDVSLRALDNAKAHLDYAQKRLDAGAGSRVNQIRASQEASADESRLEIARFALSRAQEALGVLLVANGPIDAGAEPVFAAPAADANAATRTDVALQAANVRAAQRIVDDSLKDILPSGTLAFTPQYVAPNGLFQPSKSWRLTLTFTQPIYSGGLQTAVKHQRESSLDFAKLALAAVENQAQSDVRLAREAVASNERSVASARRAADQAAEVLQITTSAFQVGATTNIEVIDAQRTARDAATTAALAEDALRQARLQLLVALGKFPG